jgi:heat shock protein HslJ
MDAWMKTRSLLLLLPLAACATMAPSEAESYRALGTEPFWSVTLANGRMTYNTPDGGFSVPAPRGQETGAGRSWETRRIKLYMWHQQCSDGMSDNDYPQTVRAVVDGRTLNGCGGAPVAGGAP